MTVTLHTITRQLDHEHDMGERRDTQYLLPHWKPNLRTFLGMAPVLKKERGNVNCALIQRDTMGFSKLYDQRPSGTTNHFTNNLWVLNLKFQGAKFQLEITEVGTLQLKVGKTTNFLPCSIIAKKKKMVQSMSIKVTGGYILKLICPDLFPV